MLFFIYFITYVIVMLPKNLGMPKNFETFIYYDDQLLYK